jgi:hypothetical protein
MEIEKFFVLPGSCLGQQENGLVESIGDASLVADSGAPEDAGWIRCCSIFNGEYGGCAGANPMETDEWDWGVVGYHG